MSYIRRYFTSFYSTADTRTGDEPDNYLMEIFELDGVDPEEELEAPEDPVQISYNNSSDNKLLPFRGSVVDANLIATEQFQLEQLYTENERKWLVILRRTAQYQTFNISWTLDDDTGTFVDRDLTITVNGVTVLSQFIAGSGQITAIRGDIITISASTSIAWPVVNNPYGQINVSGEPSQLTDDYTVVQTITVSDLDRDLIVSVITYYEVDFIAIRSAVFLKTGTTFPITFTKTYHGADQATADANAAADPDFDTEGQDYANSQSGLPAIWRGFIIPDGCQEQFMFPPYVVSINAVDGLGLLKNFSFVQNSGNFYLGKMTWIEVIYACLNRVGVPDMDIYTCVNIYEITMTQGDAFDPFALSYVNCERYLKSDGINPMDCQEVLESILLEWTACIIQSEGHWWIYRPNEAALNGTLVFRHYVAGVYQDFVSKNIDVLLGGYTEGPILAPLYHINADQLKMIAKPFKNSSISYRYGFVSSLLVNPNFTGWDGTKFTDWTNVWVVVPGPPLLTEDPLGGAKIGSLNPFPGPYAYIVNTTPVSGTIGDIYTLTVPYYNYISDGPLIAVFLDDGVNGYFLNRFGTWIPGPIETYIEPDNQLSYFEGSITVQTEPIPASGDITIRLYEAREDAPFSPDLFVTYRPGVDLTPFIDPNDPIGELHTATQDQDFSFVPDTLNVFNGDDTTITHVGAIFQEDQTTLTTLWVRKDLPESILCLPYSPEKTFLRLAVEETVRLYASPFVKFEGSIFNYFNPLSRFSINLLDGKFMPVGLVYSLQQNVCKTVVTRIANEEKAMVYTLQADFGETTKITVK